MPRQLTILLALLLLVPAASVHAVEGGRVQGTVVDENGEPVADVSVDISNEDIAYTNQLTSDKKGRFAVMFVDPTQNYLFRLTKDGYEPLEVEMKPTSGSNLKHEFVMPPAGSGGAAAPDASGVGEVNPAVEIFNEGVRALRTGDLATGRMKFEEALALEPRMPGVHTALAGIYQEEGDLDQAEALAQKALGMDENDASAYLVLYDVRNSRGDEAGAQEILDQLKNLGGGRDTAVRVFNQGVESGRQGNADRAMRLFLQALDMDPSLAPAHGALAALHFSGGDYESAIASAEKAVELDPGNPTPLRVALEAHKALGDEAAADEVFQRMVANDPEGTAEALFKQGEDLFNAGETAAARDVLEQAVAANDAHPTAHYFLGLCLLNGGEADLAKTHLERFLELAPDHPEAEAARAMLEYGG